MSHRIIAAISNFFPYCPNPAKKYDITNLENLLLKIWKLALQKQDIYLLGKVGTPLFRWYEHHGEYEEARQILGKLIEMSRQVKDRINEALYLNNFGFEYILEKKWNDAISYFELSAKIFKEKNITFEAVNARANYWLCKFELDDVDDVESVETELNEIYKIFNGARRWYERKPLILFAKIEEKRGNIKKAIDFVKNAIESARDSNTTYPEIDRKYLEHLRARTSLV
jgi:tetratricopeptide (TPR) repeat protein